MLPPREGLSRGLLECSLDMAAGFPHSKWIEEREARGEREREGEREKCRVFMTKLQKLLQCHYHTMVHRSAQVSVGGDHFLNIKSQESFWVILEVSNHSYPHSSGLGWGGPRLGFQKLGLWGRQNGYTGYTAKLRTKSVGQRRHPNPRKICK